MADSGSPCGACKFLRKKCVKGCIFAPYFCHEQGASHFAAVHKVFGASNASKLLSNLPVSDRSEAAVSISYEAQARLQDPIYGCVSHIFALQHQVVNLQAQLDILKQQAAQSMTSSCKSPSSSSENPNFCHYANPKFPFHHHHHQEPQDLQTYLSHQTGNSDTAHQFTLSSMNREMAGGGFTVNPNDAVSSYKENSSAEDIHAWLSSYGESSNYFDMEKQFSPFQDAEELQSATFGYIFS